jgi:hypothetical protein
MESGKYFNKCITLIFLEPYQYIMHFRIFTSQPFSNYSQVYWCFESKTGHYQNIPFDKPCNSSISNTTLVTANLTNDSFLNVLVFMNIQEYSETFRNIWLKKKRFFSIRDTENISHLIVSQIFNKAWSF